MKSLKFLIIATVIMSISSCTQGQMRKTVQGNKNVVTKERKVEYFTGVQASSGIDIFLKQGDNEAISVEADENLHEYIITEVKDRVLHVYTEANIRNAEKKRVNVTIKEVSTIKTSSAGDVIGESPIKSDKLELSSSSAGDIKLEVYAKNIEVNISSAGDITLSGEADILEGDLSSAGDLKAFNLKVREADISVSSAGNADINVSEKITAKASSAGDIYYQGNPKYIDVHSSSAGGVHKK